MKLLNRPCKLCGKPTRLFKAAKIKLQTADGISTLRICDECALTMESLRLLKDGRELPDEEVKDGPI